MKRIIILSLFFTLTCLPSFAQSILNPQVGSQDNPSCKITKIETDKSYTVVSFEETAESDSSWVELNKEIFIQTDVDNVHYSYIKSENIAVVPKKKNFLAKAGDKIVFKIYFQKIPLIAKTIDIIERAGNNYAGNTYFNFYNVSLTDTEPGNKITDVKITGPGGGSPFLSQGNDIGGDKSLFASMGGMGAMYKTMIKSMMDAQISYFKEPGKLAELAKMNKDYFDALRKEGFTEDQALKIAAASGLGPKAGLGEK
jgi:hypothetical protein